MKYMQNGGFQQHPLMRRTLWLTGSFLALFVVTNFLLYFDRMDLTPSSVVSYYRGSEEDFRPARTYGSMLEVSHGHMAMMALVLLVLTHLVIFAPFPPRWKKAFISIPFLAALMNEAAGWLTRFVAPEFAWLKLVGFLSLQASLTGLLLSLAVVLVRWPSRPSSPAHSEEAASGNHHGNGVRHATVEKELGHE